MKLWFIEPRANVFISGIKDSVADSVIGYLLKSCPSQSGLMVFQRKSEAPGYAIYGKGDVRRRLTEISGLQLVCEKDGFLLDEQGKSQ